MGRLLGRSSNAKINRDLVHPKYIVPLHTKESTQALSVFLVGVTLFLLVYCLDSYPVPACDLDL